VNLLGSQLEHQFPPLLQVEIGNFSLSTSR
jgi:hypothetical protein